MADCEKLEISGVTTAQQSPDLRSSIGACASPGDMVIILFVYIAERKPNNMFFVELVIK